MMNLRRLFRGYWNNNAFYIMITVALVGLSDAIYLSVKAYYGQIAQCFLTSGCEEVLTSSYSNFLGLPLSMWGIIYYSLILILINVADVYKSIAIFRLLHSIILVGFFLSLGLLYIQIFILGALCVYCLISFAVSVILMILTMSVKKDIVNVGQLS